MNQLSWLLPAPEDFNDRCAALSDSQSLASDICSLTNYSLSINQSNRLYRVVNKLGKMAFEALSECLSPLKMGLLSNSTMELAIPSMFVSAIRHGILLDVVTTDFGQIEQEAFDPESRLNRSGVDVVLLALDYRAFPFSANTLATTAGGLQAGDALQYVRRLSETIAENSGANCIVQTLVAPPFSLLGNIDARIDGLLSREIAKFNIELADAVGESADILLDIATLANNVGVANWFDERQWYLARVAMANTCIPIYAERVAGLLGAMRGKSRKCLVMDLDNTLWGGVIGDDGLDGIVLGQGNPMGESYLALQRLALELKTHGIVLAVCSKNDESNARQAFKEHPDMLLREEDIAVFVANWEDKASNLRIIAQTLNLGLDSLVFVDDNPAEREIVRMMLPEVAVPELPTDAALYARVVAAANYFETINFTHEDGQRAGQYAQNTQRDALSKHSVNIEEFLVSLNMEMTISAFDTVGRKRIVQLINKTNQFNLTTRRYTEREVQQFEESPEVVSFQVRLTDRFGDNGMISVLICEQVDTCWEINTWLMSCRVIKRGVEFAVCDQLVKLAISRGIERIRGIYLPTAKNALVEGLYSQLGFESIGGEGEMKIWELDPAKYEFKKPQMKIVNRLS